MSSLPMTALYVLTGLASTKGTTVTAICRGCIILIVGVKMFKQGKGGDIGLRLTGVMARIRMDRWSRRMSSEMEEEMVRVYLMAKYVDDVNLIMGSLGVSGHGKQHGT